MSRLVVVGTQWGDEGKGKITDYMAGRADAVVRMQGGNNAGHSIQIDGQKFALKTIPSGVFNQNTANILANGMVINLEAFAKELAMLASFNIKPNLFISSRAHLVMPYHIDLDTAYENLKEHKIGTTKNGIGPCYSDKYNRIGLRVADLLDLAVFKQKLHDTLLIKNRELKAFGLKEYDLEDLFTRFQGFRDVILPYVTDTSLLINELIEEGKHILFEGAQGTMLCIDHGSYPFVTSSSPTSAGVALNTGVAPIFIDNTLGILKAYTTRVGEGPFPTEIHGTLADHIRTVGHEYGTVTKRPRRIGYLDLVVFNYSKRISGINSIALMLLDVLTGVEELKICVSYNLDGKEIKTIPASLEEYERCIPNYLTLPGFKEDITHVRSYNDLPLNCRKYIETIEELTDTPVDIISVGPGREETIVRKEFFA